ncbi:alkaline phosphatase family protein [Nonomuraea sp. SMC257]|uniref:Alkaline phosphatase family protein n=1 Tax=Nonomuraea montanisoli TaxID=2741721 RepID=A0A7Y6I3D1_9ACTN|nr:alkaline phosphatase family protein [Nonomuraea montanisoli]NUW30957.1 alkaline phosphatase family protein [Nonomuraea montanisoli]
MRDKVLVVGMDGLRFDRLVAIRPPVLSALMSTGAYGTSTLPYGEPEAPRTESPGQIVPEEAIGSPAPTHAAPAPEDARANNDDRPTDAPRSTDDTEATDAPRSTDDVGATDAPRSTDDVGATDDPRATGEEEESVRVIRARTDSGPGWASIATGVWPDKHGVVDNGFAAPQFTKYPDFLTRAQEARPDLVTSAFFSWAALAEHGAFGPAIGTRFVLDGYALTWSVADRQVADAARDHLANAGPDLSFVYLGDTDEVAHALGPLCPEYTDALLLQDAYLGGLLDTIRARPSFGHERWTVLVTTDHGHVDAGGHGGVSGEERTVFVIGARLGEDLGGVRLQDPRPVDVAPTALDRLGIAVDPAWDLDGAPLAF